MARDYYDESKKKKKVVKKSQPSSVSVKKSIQQAQARGQKQTQQTNVKAQQSYENTRTSSVSGRSAASSRHVQDQRTPSQAYRDRVNQKSYGTTQPTRRASSPTSSNANRTRNTPATAAEMRRQQGQNQKSTAGISREQQEKTKQRFSTAKEMMNARAEEGRKQKMGENSVATKEQKETVERSIRNTPSVVKKAALDAGSGYMQTLTEIADMTASSEAGARAKAMKLGYKYNDTEGLAKVKEERRRTVKAAREDNKKLHEAQKKRQEEFDKKTKGAKGLEKAYYGALESGTGMLADIGIGAITGTGQAGSLASMYMRTFGPSVNQARDEGATDKEARRYGFWQANKEAGTELMFPGVGLTKKAYGKAAIPLAERAANRLIKGLSGRAADVAHLGLRYGLGMGEENAEEGVGWLLDPVIKEFTYGKNVRKREAKEMMNRISEDMRSKIADENDAASASAYLSSDTFLEDTKKDYMEEGLSEKEAEVVANKMRDFLTASLIGDTETMERLEDEISKDVAKAHNILEDYSGKELLETIASTSLLTGVTGLPGTVTTAMKGSTLRDELGDEGVRALAKTAIDFEDETDSYKGQAARDRLDSGKELTSTQVYELAEATQKQIEKDSKRQEASVDNASKQIKAENLIAPYGVNANGEMVVDDVINEKFETNAKTAETTIKNFDANREEGQKSLTDTAVRNGSRAIARWKAGVFTVEDANELNYSNTAVRSAFEEETGVDLGQYVVKNKNGKVDIPKTNAATKDALFAMASDNLVESAREATVNWMDNVKGEVVSQVTARMGAEGSLALQSALDDVDERNRSEYMMVANASDMLYHRGRDMGVDWEDVKSTATKMFPQIDPSKLEAMYNAGLRDREKANYEYEGKVAELGKKIEAANALKDSERANVTGKVIIDTKTPPKGTVVRLFSELANNLGVDIRLVDEIIDEKTGEVVERANGTYYKGVITINVTSGVEKNLGYIFMHEVTHHLKKYAPKEWQALENFVRERWNRYNPDHMQNEIARIMKTYSGKQKLTEEQALEELIADAAHEFLNDPNFANEVAEDNPSLAKAILESIRNALRMLRRILSTGSIDDETHMNSLFSQLGILDETERLWLNAYRTATANKAALAIDNWQDEVNAQSGSAESLSLSDSNLTVQGNTARWTDSRIDSLIRENGASDERYSKAWAAMMSPRDFLKLTIEDSTLENWMQDENETMPLDEERLRGEGQTPFLIIEDASSLDDFSYRVIGHEGRHRMIALMNAGVESVPVAIRGTEATKYKKTSIPELTLAAQDFWDGGVNDEARVNASDLVPIKESNRDELIEKFGGEADVRFSISDTDSQGNKLSEGQREFFKDSKAVDENGNLLVMYHSSPAQFTVFDRDKAGENTGYDNTYYGHFVTDYEPFSRRFGENTMQLYANITNPIVHPYGANAKYSPEELDEITKTWVNAIDPNGETLSMLEEWVADDDFDSETLWDAYMDMYAPGEDPFEYAEDDREALEAAGYDAVELFEGAENLLSEDKSGTDREVTTYAVFNSNALKNIDNENPTENDDIRYSISEQEMDAHRQTVIDEIEENYGEAFTDNADESGYIFPNGKLLKMGMDGKRYEDHRIVDLAYDNENREDSLNYFINEGNIRLMPEARTLELGSEIEPTYEQYDVLRDLAKDFGINQIEFTDANGNYRGSINYDSHNGDALVNDIKRFYRTGSTEGGSQLAQFRYSISEDPSMEQLDQHNAIVEDNEGNPVAQFDEDGSVRFSIFSYENEGRDIYKKYLDKLVKDNELSQEEADDMMREFETIYGICKEYADKKDKNGNPIYAPYTAWSYADVIRNAQGKPVFSSIKKNSEYKMNIDFSTICKKRRTLDAVFREMINRGMFEKLDLNKDESAAMVVNINNLIRKHNFEAACALCFVEARRYRQQQTATAFTDMWNGLVESMYKDKDKIAYFNFGEDSTVTDVADGIHTMADADLDFTHLKKIANQKKNGKPIQTAEAKAARLILANPSQRKLMRVGDMMASTGFENMQIQNPDLMKIYNSKKGTGGAKSSFGDVQYLNEIIRSNTFDRMKAYAVSGVRIQSFSDYVPRMVFDYVQVIADLAAKKLPAHAYTKEVLFARQFGLTGAKINLSLVPDVVADGVAPGLDADGNYVWNEEGTFPYDEALKLQEAEGYKENCGTIAVGISDEQIMKMLDDPTIQMVIPYHKSSLNPIVAAMTNVDRFTNYEDFQNTKDANGKSVKKDFDWDKKLFRLTHDTKGNLKPKEKWGNVQDLVKEYVEWCDKKGYTPKFSQFLYKDGEINPGYYKLLEDFALLDNEGNFKPQGDVQMKFPTESDAFGSMKDLIAQGLSEDTELEAKRSAEVNGMVDEIEVMFDEGTLTEESVASKKLSAKLSISAELDQPYMDAVNSNNMEEAQKLVDEAAKMAGFDTPLYHGTDAFGFTTIDNEAPGADGFSFWAASREDASATYTLYGKRRDISDRELSEEEQDAMYDEVSNEIDDAISEFRHLVDITFSEWVFGQSDNSYLRSLVDEANPQPGYGDGVYDVLSDIVFDAYHDYGMDSEMEYDEWSEESEEGQALWDAVSNIEALRGKLADIENGEIKGGIYGLYANTNNLYELDTEGKAWNELRPEGLPELPGYTGVGTRPYKTRDVANWAREKGYDGVRFKNIKDNGPYGRTAPFDVYAFFKPQEQVKSADPVTYAEDGSVIPLSERFNPESNDIRYSLPTQDSEDTILSDGQMEYFKNSQARDEQGRLVPVYHTTNKGGFTVFDPSYSDDNRSLFFASNFEVSQSYGQYARKPILMDEAKREDFTEEDLLRTLNMNGDFRVLTHKEYKEMIVPGAYKQDNYIPGSESYGDEDADGYFYNSKIADEFAKKYPDGNFAGGYRLFAYLKALEEGRTKDGEYMLIFFDNPGHVYAVGDSIGDLLSNIADANYSKEIAKRTGPQQGYYKTYLNLQNPLIVDAGGSRWNRIPYGDSSSNPVREAAIEKLEEVAQRKIDRIRISNGDYFTEENFEGHTDLFLDIWGSVKDSSGKWVDYRESKTFSLEPEEAVSAYENDGSTSSALTEKLINSWTDELGLDWDYYEWVVNEADKDGEVDYVPSHGQAQLPDYITANGSHYSYEAMFDELDENGEYEAYEGIQSYKKTRDLALIADADGYDGVIIRNCRDVGFFGVSHGSTLSDIYIAFSSNQVKDVNNLNPTENPDIRYSIVPEDETVSRMAYEAAEDDSIEILEYYEQRLANLTDEEAENIAIRDYDEDDAALFYSALRSEEPVPYEDYVLEEDRIRMARSKDDFFSNVNAKWNDRWTTEPGGVLDVKSVKTDVRNLIMGVMQNSDTDSKYKRTLVNKTLMDVRYAYEFFKKDRPELASALLYHSAQRMIDNVQFYVDGTFDQYKELKHYLRTTKISIGEEYWADVEYDSFRKRNYNRINLVKGKTNVDQVYQELEELFPEFFDSEETMDVPSQLLQMEYVLDSVQPYKEAYSSEAAAELAFDIADDLYEIMVNGDEVRSLADTYKARYDAKTKAMKQRHAEAMLRVRKARDEGIAKEKQKFREYKEKQKEKKLHTKHFDRINENYKWLKERLLTNTKDKHIPEQYKKELAGLLAAFDLQTVGSKKLETKRGYQSQKTIQMSALRTGFEAMHEAYPTFFIHDAIMDKMKELAKKVDGKTIDALDVEQIAEIDDILKGIKSDFINYDKIFVKGKQMAAADPGKAQAKIALEHAEKFGPGTDYQNAPGVIDKIINLDEMTAPYLFRRIDPNKEGLGMMYGEIRRAFDKYVRNQNELNGWMEDIVGKYHQKGILWNKYGSGELANWRSENYAVTFNFEGGSATLTPAQMMSIYCLAKRPQAQKHMYSDVGGIVVAPVSFNAKILSDVKKKANKALPVRLTESDVQQIVAKLTPEQIQVAEQLQELMSTKMADWGNEASMDVMGIELFKEDNYFPIKSDKASLTQELNDDQFVQAIRNFGFAKALMPEANNPIMVEDIFDVVTEHCNNMNLYNAYSKAFDDFMKVYNYKDYGDGGSNYTVQQAVAHAYSQKATTFIMTFLRDLNGNVSGRASGIEDAYNSLLGNAKKAAVFANLRVAAQQPTAITRALYVIDLKYASGIKIEKGAMKEMFEHCPIALWKSWGYYDINMGKSIEDIMMNNGKWLEDKATDLYGALDNVTWTAIWQMVKAEVKDKHPNVEMGSDEYWELCNERMSEVVDLTQVVDSPLHRSHAMRSKNFLVKTATAFMAEPTLTFNMIKDGWVRAREARKLGNHAEASKIIGRTIAVALLQAVTVAGAAGLIDALRKKHPDKDDEDERILHLWLVNFVENLKDELKLWNKVYFVKDIASIMEGWDDRNLALQGIQKFSLGWRQLKGDPYARSSATWYENLGDGLGYIFGVPVKTMRTGIKNAMNMFGVTSPIIDATKERLDSIADNMKDRDTKSTIVGMLASDDIKIEGNGVFGKLLAKADESDKKSGKKSKGKSKTNTKMTHDEERDALRDLEAKARENAEGLSGSELDDALWDTLSEGYTKHLDAGDLDYIEHLALIYRNCGGDENIFREKIKAKIGSAYKKTFKDNPTDEDLYAQDRMRHFMEERLGMTEEEVSAIVYKTDAARDLKVAFKINNEEYINNELTLLARAGITYEDVEKLYKNRNRMKLETYNGKYKDMLKSTGKYLFPADGIITSDFGNRNSPGGIGSTNHQGLDIAGPKGTPIQAADGGTVIMAGWYGGYGKTVQIQHDDGTVTQYSHLDWWDVNEGDTVAQGQEVGLMGNTGNSTGPHLHFGVMRNGEYVDPKEYINTNDREWNLNA